MNQDNQIIIYQTDDNQTQIDVRLENEIVWLTTNQMAMLFDREESNIRRHVINVFKEGELEKENNVHFLHVNGVKKPSPFLQSRCHHLRRLSCKKPTRCAIPPMGKSCIEAVSHQRLCYQRTLAP